MRNHTSTEPQNFFGSLSLVDGGATYNPGRGGVLRPVRKPSKPMPMKNNPSNSGDIFISAPSSRCSTMLP